jgi:hypothetical protein
LDALFPKGMAERIARVSRIASNIAELPELSQKP